MQDKEERSCFFEKTFLLTDINMVIVLRMSFLTLSNIKINFISYHIYQRTYIDVELLPTTRGVELIRKKRFAAIALNLEDEAFIVYITSINFTELNIYPFQSA